MILLISYWDFNVKIKEHPRFEGAPIFMRFQRFS